MPYDPKAFGARCAECPRNKQTPVPPEGPRNAKWCWLGQDPGLHEVKKGRPFVGPTGKRLERLWGAACKALGLPSPISRDSIWVTNAALCAPLSKSEKESRKAVECCSPRLKREIAKLDKKAGILAMGKWAMFAITGKSQKLGSLQGFIIQLGDDTNDRHSSESVEPDLLLPSGDGGDPE